MPPDVTSAALPQRTANFVPAIVWRVLRYGGVGLTISLIYSFAVIACMQLSQMSPITASIIAFVTTLPIAYLAHGRVSFADRPFDAFQPMRFAATTAMSFVVAVGGMYWITEIAGRGYLLGIAWNWAVIPTMNFLISLFWVFPTRTPEAADANRPPNKATAVGLPK